MQFKTGIAISKESENEIVVAATTWFICSSPRFNTRGFTYEHAKENLLATVVVYNESHTRAINAACHRTIESLIVKKWLEPGSPQAIELLVKPYLAKKSFILPCKRTSSHWLLNAAEAVLTAWLRGER